MRCQTGSGGANVNMSGELGTISWLERTGGRLAWRDRLAITLQGVRAKAEARRRLRSGIKIRNLEIDEILPPDSAITREALAICQDASPVFLFNHCLRAYFWARLLDQDRRPFDDEAVFTAMLLHDLGLCKEHRLGLGEGECFSIAGARAASRLALRHGWTDQRASLAAEAIALHLNVTVGDDAGKEAQMVRAGSGGDVAGLGLDVLEADQITAVVSRYPRLGMKREIIPLLRAEAHVHSACRIAFMMNHLGFDALISGAPMFAE